MRCLHSQKNTTSRTLPPSWLTSRRCIDRGTRGVQKPNPTTSEGCSIKLIVRRVLIGLVCGTISSLFLCLAVRNIGLGLSLGALLGIAQIFAFFDLRGGSAIDRAMTSATLGLPFWATINVILLPLVRGQQPQWTAEEMRALFSGLICWLLFCFLLGILSQAARELAQYVLGPESPVRVISRPEKVTQVVILGGGFAGVTTAV